MFTKCILPIKGGDVVAVFSLSFCGSVPEIFAIRVKSSPKSRRILDVFALPNYVGDPFRNLYPRYYGWVLAHRLVKFREVTPSIVPRL